MRNTRFWAVLLSASVIFAVESHSAESWIDGTVTEVIDGDTIKVRLDIKQESQNIGFESITERDAPGVATIRLAQIDAPELEQYYGRDAKRFLLQTILNRKVRVVDKQKAGTAGLMSATVSYLYKDGIWTDVSIMMIQGGAAWVDPASADEELKSIEVEAKKNRRGLFASDNPMPPWMFRQQRDKRQHKVATFKDCAKTEKSCRKMTSCSQAVYYLKTCGRTDLDPDRDGLPCEDSVCSKRINYETTFNEENDD